MDDLMDVTRYRRTKVDGNKTTHSQYQGQLETWIKVKPLGWGGCGSVWLEEGDGSGGLRAVKRIEKRGTASDHRKEIIAMAKLRTFDEYFAYFHGWYEDEEYIFLAMDYFPKGDLSQQLYQKLPEDQVRDITRQLLGGLKAMHSLGFTHRDLKPQNVFVVAVYPPAWEVRLGDFGISKRVQGNDTELRTLSGTETYMAPEMFPYLVEDEKSHSYTQAVDIWALGVLIFQMYTLKTPFGPHNPVPRFFKGRSKFPEEPLRLESITSAGVRFIKALLQPKPSDRPSSSEALNHEWLKEVATVTQRVQAADLPASESRHRVATSQSNMLPRGTIDPTTVSTTLSEEVASGTVNKLPELAAGRATVRANNTLNIKDPRRTPVNILTGDRNNVEAEFVVPNGQRAISVHGDDILPSIVQHQIYWDRVKQLVGHEDAVKAVAFSVDGRLVASGSSDNTVRLWDAATGVEVKQLKGHKDWLWSVAFSPDGRLVASGSMDKTVRLWEATTGVEFKRLKGHTHGVESVAFSPDGQLVASGSVDMTVRLWEVATGVEVKRLKGHEQGVGSVAFSPDGRFVASGSMDKTVRLWETTTGAEFKRLEGHRARVGSVAFSPDGRIVASGSSDTTVRLWEAATGAEVTRLHHQQRVGSVVFSPDGRVVACGSSDNTVRLWEAATGVEVMQLEGHRGRVWSVAFSPDGRLVASGSDDGMVRLWDWESIRSTTTVRIT